MKLTYDELYAKILDFGKTKGCLLQVSQAYNNWDSYLLKDTKWEKDREARYSSEELPYLVSSSWCTGGISGGSCWDNSNPRPYHSDDTEEELTVLYEFLELEFPSISFLQARKITDFIRIIDWTEYEYYGNRNDYKMKLLPIKELTELLLPLCT